MFGLVQCNASILARENTDAHLYFVRNLVKNWLWPIITFFGVTGNILAIIVLTKRRMIMSSTNNYLVALAIVDIAYLVLTLIVNTSQHPCFIDTSCAEILFTICRPIADFSSNTSVWLTVTFTVERWVAITYPLQSRTWCTVSRSRRIICSVLFASLLCTSPSAFESKLVRVVEYTGNNETSSFISRIRSKPTVLGESLLYHQIYFNFVTFAIIWIPLVLLIIFNAILIIYVHRSRQEDYRGSEGIKLRRHNRGNQGEQRKTTIMLIAVVIVFTVCQIPQAISLTVQSFFPILSRSSKVLIYNNFANCLVALNASINFLLYCCFSERFRLTFSSSFAFLSKSCAHYIEPNWKLKNHPAKASTSLDNVSFSVPFRQSNYSLRSPGLNNRSSDASQIYLNKTASEKSPNHPQTWSILLSKWRSKDKPSRHGRPPQLKQTMIWQSTDTCPSSPTTTVLKSPASFHRPSPSSESTIPMTNENLPLSSSTLDLGMNPLQSKRQSLSMFTFDNSRSSEKLSQIIHIGPNRLCVSSQLPLSSYSQRSLEDNSQVNRDPVWIKRHQSNNSLKDKIFCRRTSVILKEILDVAV